MFFESCSRGHLYVVNSLLIEDSVSPVFLIHGLNIASDFGYGRIVKMVLQHFDDPNFTVAATALRRTFVNKRFNAAEVILGCTPALNASETVRELMMNA
ncbi:hypothetical protein HDU81_003261, partial [Chytriomyces hyalinus]